MNVHRLTLRLLLCRALAFRLLRLKAQNVARLARERFADGSSVEKRIARAFRVFRIDRALRRG